MSNPKVRPELYFYPEDTAPRLEQTRQAEKWLHDVRCQDTTPMVRIQNTDYFIHEPAMLHDRTICMPHRWFTRNGRFYAKAWRLQEAMGEGNICGWIVHQAHEIEVNEGQFSKNFAELGRDYQAYGLPNPASIIGMAHSAHIHCFSSHSFGLGMYPTNAPESPILPWKLTNPVLGNPWRERSQGHRVLCMPLWLYCDDTSGNTSKKWNKHNSFLFTLAGLPLEQTQKEYNIHLLCTSNLAPPLEMMEGVVDQVK